MALLSWRQWLKRMARVSQRGSRQVKPADRPRCQLGLEQLEQRCLLAVFTVMNTLNSGLGSLRQAILDANAISGLDMIQFAIGSGVQTISPTSALPTISDSVIIDGTTQPGFAGSPLIVLNGSSGGLGANGLTLAFGGSTVKGLVINAFASGDGISLQSPGNLIVGNYIGTDITGTKALGNGNGVRIGFEAENNTIGGTTAAARNVISGNFGRGIHISSKFGRNLVQGNYIGTNVSGTVALGNGGNGVTIQGSPENTIGGTTIEARNLISGNSSGVSITGKGADRNRVQGNYIGTDITGTKALGNSSGVSLGFQFGADNTIWGTVTGARNLISGNKSSGVVVRTDEDNQVQGNFIGTDVTGTKALGNGKGVWVIPSVPFGVVLIGGTAAGAGNLISGNTEDGILIVGGKTQVQGNFIGTDVTGTTAVANGVHGVSIAERGNTIGGATTAARNLISGNKENGVFISGAGASGNQVQGNYIGTDFMGMQPLGNVSHGVLIQGGSNNTIGGTTTSEGNVIAHNTGDGVSIESGTGNLIRGNSIHSNGGLGIDLGPDGVTNNDDRDIDTGANNLQNFPALTSAQPGAMTRVVGTLNSMPNTMFQLDFYASPSADPSGYGEGRRYLGPRTVTTNASGDASFDLMLPAMTSAGEVITATATDPGNNTSEFSAALLATSINQPPVLQPITDRTVPSSQQVITVPLMASDPDGDPLTFSATVVSLAYAIDQQYDFFTDGNFYENLFGAGEKWVQSAAITSGWAFLLPSGELRAWDGSGSATGPLLGNVGAFYHSDPNRLINVPPNPYVTVSVAGSTLTLTRSPISTVSSIRVTAMVSDGRGGTDSRTFNVIVTAVSNQPPVLQPIADRTVPSSQITITVPLVASDPDGDPLTFTATAVSLAYQLDQQYGLFSDGNYYENSGGRGERWVQGTAPSGWFFILPNGELYEWDGQSGANGTLVGNVGASYHTNPTLLHDAVPNPHATLSISGSTLTITREAGFVGAFVITVTVSDGLGGMDSRTFTVTVTV